MTSATVKRIVLPVLLLGLWWYGGVAELWSPYVLPSPSRVWRTFIVMLGNGSLFADVAASVSRVLIGFSISFVSAFVLGVIAGCASGSTVYYAHILEFFRHVPPLSLIPLLILWMGIGEASKVAIIVLATFFPMFMSVKKGFSGVDVKLLEVGRSFRFSKWKLFSKIMLPCALPDVLVGMRMGLGYSWRAIIGAEMIAAASGLGYLILDAQQMSRSDKVVVGIFVIGVIGFMSDRLFAALIQKSLPGGVEDSWN